MNEFLIIDNLKYKDLFEQLSFKIKQGQFITVSGGNNCGKTTLIRALSRKIPTKNSINLFGRYIEEYPTAVWDEVIGTIIQQDKTIYSFPTVEEELRYIIDLYKKDKEVRNQIYKNMIKTYKLTKYQKENPNHLEAATKMRMELAKSMVTNPQVLLLDDICHKLDVKSQKEILEIINGIKEEQGVTIIMTTSNLEISLISDYLYIIDDGKILLEGTPLEVIQKDNILNRIGLELPFMADLSVKLRDYNLIEKIELDMDRMVNHLWK